MSTYRPDPPHDPKPPELAAYVDGELGAAASGPVEAWLADHPEAAAEVESQRRLLRLWRETRPPEPTEAEWAAILTRLEAALPAASPALWVEARQRAARYRRALVWAAVAAASIAAVLVGRSLLNRSTGPGNPPGQDSTETPFEVASDADVEIISIEGDDVSALVAGEPPVREPLVLALPGEVTVREVDLGGAGSPPVRVPDRPTAPMIWVGGATAKEGDQ
jgi:anti-sigma factor RsiW